MACGEALVSIDALFAISPIVDVHENDCPSVWALGRFSSPISCVSYPLLTRDVSGAFQSSLEGGAAKHLSVAIATHLAAVNRRLDLLGEGENGIRGMKECFGRIWTASRSSEQLLQSSVSEGGTNGNSSSLLPYFTLHPKHIARYSSLPANESHSYEVQLRSERTRVRWDGQRPRKAKRQQTALRPTARQLFAPGPFSLLDSLSCRVLHQIPKFSHLFHALCRPIGHPVPAAFFPSR